MAFSAYVDEFSRQPWRSLLLLCCAGAAGLLLVDRHHHGSSAAWATMLLAMMPLLLAQPITHIVRSTRARRRGRTLIAFGVGYAFVWMLAGPLLMRLSEVVTVAAGDSRAAVLAATLVALAWSATPWHQVALNRGHRMKNLAVFGWRAEADAMTYGLVHGVWCVASCWAWMLVPLAAHGHGAATMIVVTALMLVERLAAPAWPRWRLPLPLRLFVNRHAHA